MIKFDSALVGLKIQTRVDAVLEAYSRNEAVDLAIELENQFKASR